VSVKYSLQVSCLQNIENKWVGFCFWRSLLPVEVLSVEGLNEKLQGDFSPCSFLAVLSISDETGVMRHVNPLVWRGDLLVWGLTGILAHGLW
jgi:hypothetical protein